jgi:CRP-like cAMP-binding protein
MDQLSYFRLFHNLPGEDFIKLESQLGKKSLKKNEFITQPGQIQKELLFCEEGVQMSYFETDDKVHVIAFTYPPNPCAIPESFNSQTPSRYYLKCLTDSSFKCISFERLQNLFNESQEIERLCRKMTEIILGGVLNRHMELQSLTIEERYLNFCKRSPHLLQLVPHKYIASYLGIDSTNFSKLYNSVKI